ncbi:MAG: AraC family transcriptional regulator [Planctomycetaceae bacterium]|jgi:AraC family L-rhamnose operon regulatory protein RhaS|nr:AraC family transcriptional regulator [Planctomycetaceae bacterium]
MTTAKNNTPVYQEGNTAYSADTCSRLTEAAQCGEVLLKSFARGQYPGQPIPKDALPGLRTVGFWSAVAEQQWGLDWHRNEGIEVTFLLSGKNRYETNTQFWEMHAGDVAVCPPWQIHRIGNPNVNVGTLMWFILDTQIRQSNQTPKLPAWIILSEEDKNKLIRRLLYSSSQVIHLSEKFVFAWKKLYRILRDSGKECPVSALAIIINELLLDLLNVQENNLQSASPQELPRSVGMVQTFFQELASIPEQLEHPWTLREMARLCRISPTRFSHCCRQLTNLSPLNALNQLRVRQAEAMIQNEPQKSITEIAMQCGFTTSQYFATVFKKWTGKTPSEYKNNRPQQKPEND